MSEAARARRVLPAFAPDDANSAAARWRPRPPPGIFPDEDAIARLDSAVLLDRSDEGAS